MTLMDEALNWLEWAGLFLLGVAVVGLAWTLRRARETVPMPRDLDEF